MTNEKNGAFIEVEREAQETGFSNGIPAVWSRHLAELFAALSPEDPTSCIGETGTEVLDR